VELQRNSRILRKLESVSLQTLTPQEKRFYYFSTKEGHGRFLDKVRRMQSKSNVVHEPTLEFGGEILGPWSKICTVYRTVYEHYSSYAFDALKNDFFYF